jgi:hypothetical protein
VPYGVEGDLLGVPTFFPPKIPAKPVLYWGRSGKRSNSGKETREKRLSVSYRRAFHGQDTFFAGFMDQDLTVKASFSFQEALASLKTRFLAGILGGKNVGTPIQASVSTRAAPYGVLVDPGICALFHG